MFGKVTVDGTCPVCGDNLGLGEPACGNVYTYCTKCDKRLNITGYPSRGRGYWGVSKSGWFDFLSDADCRQCYWEYLAEVRLKSPFLRAFISVFILKKWWHGFWVPAVLRGKTGKICHEYGSTENDKEGGILILPPMWKRIWVTNCPFCCFFSTQCREGYFKRFVKHKQTCPILLVLPSLLSYSLYSFFWGRCSLFSSQKKSLLHLQKRRRRTQHSTPKISFKPWWKIKRKNQKNDWLCHFRVNGTRPIVVFFPARCREGWFQEVPFIGERKWQSFWVFCYTLRKKEAKCALDAVAPTPIAKTTFGIATIVKKNFDVERFISQSLPGTVLGRAFSIGSLKTERKRTLCRNQVNARISMSMPKNAICCAKLLVKAIKAVGLAKCTRWWG